MTLRIANMDCPSEERQIRHAVERMAGVQALRFDPPARQVTFEGSADAVDRAVQAIRSAGFEPACVQPPGEDK